MIDAKERVALERSLARYTDKRGEDECWPWTGVITDKGEGQSPRLVGPRPRRRWYTATRAAFVFAGNELPDAFHIHHRCLNPICMNTAHMQALSPGDHQRAHPIKGVAAVAAAKTHCPRGHEYDLLNTRWNSGKRSCRACQRERYHERKQVSA